MEARPPANLFHIEDLLGDNNSQEVCILLNTYFVSFVVSVVTEMYCTGRKLSNYKTRRRNAH